MTVYSNGTLLQNRYEVRDLRMGGMGIVYYCIDKQENMPVALKTYQDKYLDDFAARDAFINECQIWIGIGEMPNIVRAFRLEMIFEKPYICVELVASNSGSPDLRTRIERKYSKETALRIAVDICLGMEQALEKYPTLTHRDLKPENILITNDERAKITDFGLSKVGLFLPASIDNNTNYDEMSFDRTHHSIKFHNIAGTPPYMAPEQWMGDNIDTRADIYAFGCILFELLTGNRAFNASSIGGYKIKHLTYTPERGLNDVDENIKQIILQCLEKKPRDRFLSFADIRKVLVADFEHKFGEISLLTSDQKEISAQEMLDFGESYQLVNDYHTALSYFQRAIEIEPSSWKAWSNIGSCYYSFGDFPKGLEAAQRSLEIFFGQFACIKQYRNILLGNG
jgi:serine/threonine protein kinase